MDSSVQVDKIFISSFLIGRLSFVVNIRCGRQGGNSTEEPPKTEVIRAVLSALNVRASISDAHLVLSKRVQKDICGPVDRLAEEIVLSYVGNVSHHNPFLLIHITDDTSRLNRRRICIFQHNPFRLSDNCIRFWVLSISLAILRCLLNM